MEPVQLTMAVRQMPRAHLSPPPQQAGVQSSPQLQLGGFSSGKTHEKNTLYGGQNQLTGTFGNGLGVALGQTLHNIVNHGPSRVILEDLIGFGGLRTGFDLSRNWIYGTSETQGANTSLARERIFREVGNLFATNFLGGVLMYAFAKGGGNDHIGTQFASMQTTDYLNKLVASIEKNAHAKPSHTSTQSLNFRSSLIDAMSKDILADLRPQQRVSVNNKLEELFKQLDGPQREASFEQVSTELEKELGSDHKLTRKLKKLSNNPSNALNKLAKELDYFIEKESWVKKNPTEFTAYKKLRNLIQSSSQLIDDAAEELIGLVNTKANSFDIELHLSEAKNGASKDVHTFKLNTLIEDAYEYTKSVEAQSKVTHNPLHSAKQLLKKTEAFKKWAFPLAFGASFVFTVVVPLLNKMLTRKVDNIESYPGEIGLRDMEKVNNKDKGWFEKYMPYITNNLKDGNPMPLIYSLLPLPFATGMVDNAKLMGGKWDVKMPWAKGFGKRFRRMFQFRKVFPYVPVQQLTALCALVSSARVWTARDQIEARERYVDSYGGWALWIGVLPNIKNQIKNRLDKIGKTAFNGRDLNEVVRFTKDKDLIKSTLKKNKVLESYIFLPLMLVTMGIVEPLIALKWTESQVKKIFGNLNDKKWLQIGQRLNKRAVPNHAQQVHKVQQVPSQRLAFSNN